MLKNSQILPIFGLGLILSTSPLFTLLDSSIVSPETVKLDGQEEGEVSEVAEDTESSSATTTLTEETLPEEPSLDSSTTTDESQEKEDSLKQEDPVDSSSQQQETKELTEDTQSKPKEKETEVISTATELPKVVVSTTSNATTTTESSSTPASSEAFKVASTAPSSPTLKTTEASSTVTPTNRDSQPSSNAPKSSESTVSQKQGRKRREYVKDYTGNERTSTSGVHSVTFTNGESKYLYSHDGILSFSIPKTLESQQQKFQKISVDNIHISLFKNTAWNNKEKSVDKYEEISKEDLKDLFALVDKKDQDKKKKLRQLLVSLSNRREWTYHTHDTTFKSELKEAEVIWKEGKDKENELEIKIKYFLDYKELKEYVEEKLEKCGSQEKGGPCLADEKELTIIDQDKKSFFTDSKKK